ncbi:MAG: GAF domain-containing protein [Anaerolineales bacterium]|nr:GAF domain-containing protein [Anaerolineales bacterium]
MNIPSQSPNQIRLNQNGSAIVAILLIASALSALMFAYFGFTNNLPLLYLPAISFTLTVYVDLVALSLIRQERTNLAMLIIAIVFIINVSLAMVAVQGLGLIIAISTIFVLLAIVGLAMTPNYTTSGLAVALLLGILMYAFDSVLGTNRISVPQISVYSPYIVLAIVLPIFVVFIRQFNNLSLQTKITLGILLTGGMIVATIAFFGLERTGEIINNISGKYETSVADQTESEILSRVQAEANRANLIFSNTQEGLITLAEYRSNFEDKKVFFIQNNYWNSAERIFQLSGGQFGNSGTDPASIFIPNTVTVDEEMLADINTSIYLDFLAPNFLEVNPQVVAVYYISAIGYTIYYPNTNLAQNVPPDFDPRTEAFYTIATPERNPDGLPQLTNPYQDPAGAGEIVTLSVPVYNSGEFKGVMGADIALTSIVDLVSTIQLTESDFAFVIDKNGFIIYMPEKGYQDFGIEQRESTSLLTRQSLFDTEIPNLEFAAQRIVFNQANLVEVPIGGINTYVASAVLPTTQYKLVFFAPADELNTAILASRQEVQNEIQVALQNAGLILIGLFIGALLVSLVVGQVITRPVRRLTNTVEKVTSGDLSARAEIETQDEAGLLARSFNEMTARLSDTLQGLEGKVAERTAELEIISQSNAKRAAEFESIARISRIISSTQTLDKLLPQIVQNISEEFGFYHVGIFLLDVHKEYAVLVAANSEGGRRMLERGHRLKVGETGIVGFVTRAGQPRIALDVGADAVFFNNPDLPETRSEIALPLRVEAEIFGAVDVQSTKTNAFTDEDISILSVLADQVSIAIQNARSYQQSREALEQAETTAAQMIEQQWSDFLRRQNITQYHFDGVEARQQFTIDKQTRNLAIPLILRGAQIGTLKLTAADPDKTWDEDEIAIAQATAERTALAIENARLLQEAQKRATKERTIGEISTKIGNTISLESIIKTAIQEIGNTLPGADVAIQFTQESSEQ